MYCSNLRFALCAILSASPLLAQAGSEPTTRRDDGVRDGWMIVEGDIQVPEDFYTSEAPFTSQRWPGGVVPYRFDSNVSSSRRALMLNAFSEWEAVADLAFVVRTDEDDFVHVRDSSGDDVPQNSSPVGRIGGEQTINITSWGSHYILMHEVGHSLGYWHEQSRPDRDDYVAIQWDNISQTACGGDPCDHNFVIHSDAGTYGPYDFDSFMHYGQFAFSGNGQPTIQVLPPWDEEWQDEIGQLDHMSYWDETVMSFLYARDDWVFVDPTTIGFIELGTFSWPFDTFSEGLGAVPAGGSLIVLEPMTASVGSGLVEDEELLIRAPLGGLVIR